MTALAGHGVQLFRQELTAHPSALAGVRRIVGAYLRVWGLTSLVESTVCCVNELLSNVDRHTASSACVLILQRRGVGVRVVVSDTSSELPVLREPDWASESGRGIALVESMADAWGAVPNDTGKDVWFEIRDRSLPGEAAA